MSATEANAVDLLTGASSRDFSTGLTMGLTWEATRTIRAGCDVAYRNRPTRSGIAGYDATDLGCFGSFIPR